MGLIKTATAIIGDAVGGAFSDALQEIIVPAAMNETTLAVTGIAQTSNAGRGDNLNTSTSYITNGSIIRVPAATALILVDQGNIHDVVLTDNNNGGEYKVDNAAAPSLFVDGPIKALVSQSWERFKFGGQPSNQMVAYFINLKEIRGLTFGTPGPIPYKDYSLVPTGSDQAPVLRLIARGRYSIQITDPVLFFKNFLPAGAARYQADDEQASAQLFSEFIGTFNSTLNSLSKAVHIADLPSKSVELAQAMSAETGPEGTWQTRFGITIVAVGVEAIEYDDQSREIMDKYNAGLMMQGGIGNAYAQTTVAEGIKAAGETGGGANMMGLGMGVGAIGGTMAGLVQPTGTATPAVASDPTQVLSQLKSLLDQGLITQEQFAAKQQEVLSRM
jgi:membrane protease subunit (stomatin/prohibitin family)